MLPILLLLMTTARPGSGLQCWQCASVDNRSCPEDAKMVDSSTHDACITWRLGNGTVILQNVVMFENECTITKISFWTRFIDLYYQSEGGEVRCCDTDGCNTGAFTDDFFMQSNMQQQQQQQSGIPGAPLIFGAVSSSPNNQFVGARPTPPSMVVQQNNAAASAAAAFPQMIGQNLQNFAFVNPNGFLPPQPQGSPQIIATRQQLTPQIQSFIPQSNNIALAAAGLQGSSDLNFAGFPQSLLNQGSNGNCQRYFTKQGDGEWLPNTLMPLSFDRASETKVGVFYAKFNALNGNNDHVIVRLVNKNRSNSTMYSFKLYRVGSVSLFVSKLEPSPSSRNSNFNRVETRRASQNQGINLTDTTVHRGFWVTVKEDELALGMIGDQLIEPVLIYNDTLREGPRDVSYFALTTEQSVASFGVNCDVPDLHFEDTCVSDEDCEEYPNTVCSAEPINRGLDPGTRSEPFSEWEPRDTLLKSCFCAEGHMRIPLSAGCYDPIRVVVTLKDACFADYHCNDLPNTHCVFDRDVLLYNKSCQCIPGNKPFDTDPRTGLIEGCAPLTEADKASILGCASRVEVDDNFAWVPEDLFPLERNEGLGVDQGVVFVKLGPPGQGNNRQDVAIIRLLDEQKNDRKFYTIKFYRQSGKITISESTRSRSFFFENERDSERVSIDELDVITRMQLSYVGLWIHYKHEDGLGGTLSVGLNGSPFSPDYSLARWTDTSTTAIRRLAFAGFTATAGSSASFGTSCVLLDTPIGVGANPFVQLQAQQQQQSSQQVLNTFGSGQFPGASINTAFSNNNLNRVNPNLAQQQLIQAQNLQNFQNLQNRQGFQQSVMPNFQNSQTNSNQQVLNLPSSNPWDFVTSRRNSNAGSVSANSVVDPSISLPGAMGLVGATGLGMGHSVNGGGYPTAQGGSSMDLNEPPATEEPKEIIEPVLRNQYLTKLQRLLPTLYDKYVPNGAGSNRDGSSMGLADLDKMFEQHQLQQHQQQSGSRSSSGGGGAGLHDDDDGGSSFDIDDVSPMSETYDGK